ncbi:O-antigen polymerase [Escherichia coli]|uniref:O-antigen polymerase n=1 Tax=Escherichia coli TaxID=562 RepID=UPI003873BFD8
MAKYDFFLLYTQNIEAAIFFLLISLLSVWLIMRKHVYSIYDPMFFFLILAASGYSVVYFLYYLGMLSSYYFFMFLLTQWVFFVGWKLNRPIRVTEYKKDFKIDGAFSVFYYLTSLFFVISQLVVYRYKGIPLFAESRLEFFSGGDGFGIFNRIIIVTSTISLSIALFRIIYLRRRLGQKFYDLFFVLFYLAVQVLSGSKSGLLVIAFIYGLTTLYAQRFNLSRHNEKRIKKYIFLLVVLAIPIALITIYIQSMAVYGTVDISFLLIGLMMRFVNTGDIFFMAWPNDFLNGVLSSEHGFLSLFKDFLGALRLIPQDELPVHMGLVIFDSMYNTDVMSGPNARHNVFGLFYFGAIGGTIYSFILGWLVGFLRNKVYYISGNGVFGLAIYVSLAYYATFIEQDFSGMAMMYYFSFSILFPVLYLITLTLYKGSKK